MTRFRMALAALALIAAADPSQAGFLLTFDQPEYTVAVGGTVDLIVSVRWDQDGDGSDPLNTVGMISGGVGLRSASSGLFQPINTATDIFGNSSFDVFTPYDPSSGSPFTGTNLIAGFSEGTLFGGPVTSVEPGASVFLGTFRVTAASPGVATVFAGRLDPDGGSVYLVLNDNTSLDDGVVFGSARVTVTGSDGVQPVPAPMSAVLLLGSTFALAGGRFLKRLRTA